MFRIGGLEINKLSGPVTLRYLVPKKEVFLEKANQGIFLPIIILLGDKHDGKEDGRCDPCDEEKGCFLVESDTFLSTLNGLAASIPIDLYTEYAKDVQHSRKSVLFTRFLGKTSECHRTENRVTTRYRCSYKNIRWHYADPRFWKNTVENEVSEITNFLSTLRSPNTDLRLKYYPENEPKLFKKFMTQLLSNHKEDRTMRQLCKSLSTLMRNTLDNKSLVYKQLHKYTSGLSIDFYCYSSLEFHGMVTDKKVSELLDKNIVDLSDYIFIGKRLTGDFESYKKTLTSILELWVTYTACILDMYFLGRMFKPPQNNINSYLTIGFFGFRHTRAISSYLSEIETWYDVKYSSDELDRCLRIDKGIDANSDLESYSKWRSFQDIKPYIDRMLLERRFSLP